jgi:hypothetical protein
MVFVTGMQRSGTTLLDKLLASHPDLAVLSQPFPLLFVETKRAFLHARRQDGRYPLGHFFGEDDHALDDVTAFLSSYRVGSGDIGRAMEMMSGFSGQYTRISPTDAAAIAGSVEAGVFGDVLRQLYQRVTADASAAYCGGKETLCEEFVPHLLSRGAHALLIIRDPRDVVTSLNHGSGENWGGRPKPTLFNVRHWRKSVAIALSHREHPRVRVVRYEDLVADPRPWLAEVAAMLGVAPFPQTDLDHVPDQSGDVWPGNSSFAGEAGRAGAGRYREVLDPAVARYIEATCLPELKAMGYATSMDPAQAAEAIRGFEEPYRIEREGLETYTGDPHNVALELRRLEALVGRTGLDDPALFVTREAGAHLARALA